MQNRLVLLSTQCLKELLYILQDTSETIYESFVNTTALFDSFRLYDIVSLYIQETKKCAALYGFFIVDAAKDSH